MNRRDFLKLSGAVGLSLSLPALASPPTGSASQADEPYTGTFFVTVNAGGGWDATMLCDPRGSLGDGDTSPINRLFTESAIEQAGAFRYAPIGHNATFFTRFADRLMVINGVDTRTNNHDVGARATWSGTVREGAPAFAALVAAQHAPTVPMAYISAGGYDATAGTVARTRAGTPNSLLAIAYPNRPAPDQPQRVYHTEETYTRILEAQERRIARQLAAQTLPRPAAALNQLHAARGGAKVVSRLTDHLPSAIDTSSNPLKRQAQVAIAAYKAGIAASANLNLGGFDTHGAHDATHVPKLQALLEGVEYLLDEAERQGVADKLFVMMGSDFGRTPKYNGGGGKDHWPVTSVMLLGPGVPGGRLIGATDDGLEALDVDPTTLLAVPRDTPGAVRITPAHVHRALRDLAGVDPVLDAAFPLEVETPLALFG